ncbi:hypothetical protein ACFPK6_08475 [Dokdonella soli]
MTFTDVVSPDRITALASACWENFAAGGEDAQPATNIIATAMLILWMECLELCFMISPVEWLSPG